MSEEIVFAPVAGAPHVTLKDLASAFAACGYDNRIDAHDGTMCWMQFIDLESRFVVSTSPDDKKEVGLITFEYMPHEPERIVTVVFDVLDSLGFSSEPDAQYR